MNRTLKLVLIGIGGIIGACVLFACALGAIGVVKGTPTPQPTTLAVVANTSTVPATLPAATVAEVATPAPTTAPTTVPPTNTPEPTAAPTTVPPTPTDDPMIAKKAAVKQWAQMVMGDVKNLGTALGEIGQLAQHPRIGQDDWTVQMATNITMVKASDTNLRAMDPPAGAEDLHQHLLAATGKCDSAMDHLVKGVDNVDESELTLAINDMNSCTARIVDLNSEMQQYAE